jgi:DNA-binding GntR family transcriptional regulator
MARAARRPEPGLDPGPDPESTAATTAAHNGATGAAATKAATAKAKGAAGPMALNRLAAPASQGDMVLNALSLAIREGRLKPGSLHSAASLAEQLGVSRTPVREALLQLARDGAVRFERNRGARILQTSQRDLREIFQIRSWLEVPATRIAAEVRTAEDLERLGRALSVLEDDHGELTAQDIRRQDHNFHVTLMEIAGNERLSAYVDTLRGSVLVHDAMNAQQRRLHAEVVDEHRPILAAVRDQDPEAAGRAMADHLERTCQVLMRNTSA